MKKKNIISLAGVVALLMGLGLNLEYALDDYGLKSNSLNLLCWHKLVIREEINLMGVSNQRLPTVGKQQQRLQLRLPEILLL